MLFMWASITFLSIWNLLFFIVFLRVFLLDNWKETYNFLTLIFDTIEMFYNIFNGVRVTAVGFPYKPYLCFLCISVHLADAQCPRMHWGTILSFYPVIFQKAGRNNPCVRTY